MALLQIDIRKLKSADASLPLGRKNDASAAIKRMKRLNRGMSAIAALKEKNRER